MNIDEFKAAYKELTPQYQRLAENIVPAIREFLQKAEVSFLDIGYRIKTIESAQEKVLRKQYVDPCQQIEDFCGVRVICYYPSDVEKIAKILRSEFHIEAEEDTQKRLHPNEFGYRSIHLIATLQPAWLKAPNYRGLEKLKIEFQIRTILMHAWAEIEHKLAYKSENQVPVAFKRKLYRLSAKFEEADEQFEELRHGINEYRQLIKDDAKAGLDRFRTAELNLDTFQTLLDEAFPKMYRNAEMTAELLEEIAPLTLSMADLIDAINIQQPLLEQLVRFDYGNTDNIPVVSDESEDSNDQGIDTWAQVGAMRNALDLSCDTYCTTRLKDLGDILPWRESVQYGRSLLGKVFPPK